MYKFLIFLHIIVAISLIVLVLIQRGRSSGLVEALGGVESIFGTKTNQFFVRLTTTLAILFFITSISLAYLSKQEHKSLIDKVSSEEKTPSTMKQSPDKDGSSLPLGNSL
jgi:preprotein translocase subunit SecG